MQPQPTTPGATRTLSSGNGGGNDYNSPPVDWCVQCTGGANSIGGITVQRGDAAHGQPGNYGDAVNTMTAGSDGCTTTVTKTYDNDDVKLRNMKAPAPQVAPPQAPVTPLVAAGIRYLASRVTALITCACLNPFFLSFHVSLFKVLWISRREVGSFGCGLGVPRLGSIRR